MIIKPSPPSSVAILRIVAALVFTSPAFGASAIAAAHASKLIAGIEQGDYPGFFTGGEARFFTFPKEFFKSRVTQIGTRLSSTLLYLTCYR